MVLFYTNIDFFFFFFFGVIEGDQPWDFLGRNDAKLKLSYFGHLR